MLKVRNHINIDKFKTLYMVCCWSGNRRIQDLRYKDDKTFYIKNHYDSLVNYKHNLNHIVLAVSDNPREDYAYKQYIDSFPKRIQSATVEVIRRPNIGMSYGALSDIFKKYKQNFDYYFTIEDDYKFTQNNFDKIFISKSLEDDKIAFVSCLAGKVYADISVGCLKSKALTDFANTNNGLIYPYPYDAKVSNNYNHVYQYGQFNMGIGLRKLGYTIVDLRNNYRCAFRDPRPFPNNLRWFHTKNKESIVLPI